MGIFFSSPQRVVPAIQAAIHNALTIDPKTLINPEHEAAARTLQLTQVTTPQFHAGRFFVALAIAVALLVTAIYVDHDHPDISKELMGAFSGYSGIVLGLLGGEAQKSV